MKWFKHDSDANMDGKLQDILLDYGLEGYGLYWYCIEMITSKVSKENLTFELEHDSRIIARNTGSTAQKVQEMMKRFVELGLFDNSDGNIRCLKLLKRLDSSMTNNKEMRSLIQKAKNSHDGVMTQSDNVMLEESRIDKNRIDKTKEVKQEMVVSKPKLDWSVFGGITQEQINEIKQLRQKTKGLINERFINSLSKQFQLTINAGYSINEILDVWVDKGWKTYKHEWFMNLQLKSTNQQSAHEIAATYGVIK